MAVHECPLCGASCGCHGADEPPSLAGGDRCFHVCVPLWLGGDWEYGEPTGSCDDCGINLYGDEAFEGLCDQCSWARHRG